MRPCVLENFHPQDSPFILLTILADHATGLPVPSRCLKFSFRFWFSSGSLDGSPRTVSMLLVLSLLVDAGCCVGTTPSCDNDVGDAGVAELEEPVDKPGTTIGT